MNTKILRCIRRCTALAIAFSISTAVFTVVPKEAPAITAYASDAQVKKYEDQLAALKKQQKDLEKQLASAKNEAAGAASKKQYLDNLVYTTETKIATAQALIEELEGQMEVAMEEITEKEELIAKTQEKFLLRMRMAHEDGNASYIGIILGSGSISDLLSRVERVNAMLEYDRTLKKEYLAEKAKLEEQKASLEASVALQKETLAALEADKADAEKLSKQAEAYYNEQYLKSKESQAELEKIKKAEDELDAQLTAYLKSIQEQNSSQVTADGEYMWPLPKGGYISCTFGGKDPLGRPHYAVDCAIAGGTPISAVNDGTVLTATSHSSYGYYIVIDHGNGISSLYAHCSALYVSAGQQVKKGQKIGAVGSTGFSTGNHLHLEFRVGGNKVNPYNYVHP